MDKIKCIKFPKIEQFRNVVTSLNRQFNFVGLDDNGDAMYNLGMYYKEQKDYKNMTKYFLMVIEKEDGVNNLRLCYEDYEKMKKYYHLMEIERVIVME